MGASISLEGAAVPVISDQEAVGWIAETLPGVARRLLDADGGDSPLLQLPAAQLRLAHALYHLDGVAETGEPMGALCERLGTRRNALTQAADRLIHNGLAERVGDAADRRIVRLRLTSEGREWIEARVKQRQDRLARLWQALNLDERASVLDAVRTLRFAVERLAAIDSPVTGPDGGYAGVVASV